VREERVPCYAASERRLGGGEQGIRHAVNSVRRAGVRYKQ